MIEMLDDLARHPGKYVSDMPEITGLFIGSSEVEAFIDEQSNQKKPSIKP